MKKLKKRWLLISVGLVSPEELNRGMEIATTFEDRHGNKPPMYFARYMEDNTVRITVLTDQDSRKLKRHFHDLGTHSLNISEHGGGSWAHCHAYQAAKHLFGKAPKEVQDVVHWMHNMCNYGYLQEIANYAEVSAFFLNAMVPRPGGTPPTAG